MKFNHYLCSLFLFSVPAISAITVDTPEGSLKFYGDVEFNVDAASKTGQLTSLRTSSGNIWNAGNKERWDVNGRILLGVDGYRSVANNKFAGFTVQPLADLSGNMNLDDAAFFFGQEKDWKVKVGRYEAFDMFPLNQDTLIEYSGNTANNLYDDGFGYIYMMKEGRGRSSAGGAIQLSKMSGPFYFELNTFASDGTKLFQDQAYHGNALENKKNVIYLRPIIAYTVNDVTAAIAMETNVVSNAYGYNDANGVFNDQSKRNGYGATFSWNGQKSNPDDGVVFNLSTAYLDATDEKDFSAGTNALWHDFELGYIYAKNDVQKFNFANTDVVNADEVILGKYNIHTVHASYRIRNVMEMDNFDVYLGAYWSRLSMDNEQGDDKDRYGARVRFKYHF
ncbi:carbohydrate porin [Klebsiella variicola]|uniref:carbohydrate porin n=1 Tax=Klebsiella variicola TaxID=244366 RepID=UPI0009BAC773|nr:carbohydrate porin [Klebsiella variicola]EIW9274916.1 carbohydrate porin [Klebsiella variicola]ELC9130722.1 carbohydrate porin [Klebsiella variicola]MBG2047255.1 carbohydrate porin [Klebsiella variicola]MBR7370707.1 porin [Klebsiella variicola]MBZ6721166.1 porin [Klebsiella variicola]